ncbi:hypothetical protein DOY81_013076, partial [Sarcophaga bullata]
NFNVNKFQFILFYFSNKKKQRRNMVVFSLMYYIFLIGAVALVLRVFLSILCAKPGDDGNDTDFLREITMLISDIVYLIFLMILLFIIIYKGFSFTSRPNDDNFNNTRDALYYNRH